MRGCSESPASILGVPPISSLEEEARRLLGCDPAHGWPHILRVASWAKRILEAERLTADLMVLYVSILLHDAGRSSGGSHHAVESARIARSLLPAHGLQGILGEVEHAVLAHSYSLGVRAETVEAKVLSDADKLDALGAVGIARVFHTGCQLGRGFEDSVSHFYDKILRLPTLMHYPYSRRKAAELAARVEEFLGWWRSETGGNT
ncbi:MAG: HD domain-containing protein [Desulfurococcales archaeon]|nr:HD domain-containing protein [Desulfurococcales archaeon]